MADHLQTGIGILLIFCGTVVIIQSWEIYTLKKIVCRLCEEEREQNG